MKPSKQSRHFYKQALININNAYARIRRLEESLNFQNFNGREPEILVTDDTDQYGISLYWNDIIFDMEEVFQAFDNHLQITPGILENLLYNN